MSEDLVCKGKVVYFDYVITTDDDGKVVEESNSSLGYVHGGYSELIGKVEEALDGCAVNDKLSVPLLPSDNLWAYDPALVFTDNLNNVPEQFRKIGAEVEMTNDRGENMIFVVTEISEGKLTADGNHPLAGKAITFHITVTAIRDASPEEITSGQPAGNDSSPSVLH